MNLREAAWLAQQRRRWMLPDQNKWKRPEPVWRMPPQGPAQPQERKYQAPVLYAENLARLSRSLAILRRELASVQAELLRRKAGFDPNQPRVPAGSAEGGQWTDGGGGDGGLGRSAGSREQPVSDDDIPQTLPHAASDGRVQVASDITGFTRHGINQAITRGVAPSAIRDAVINPLRTIPQPNGTTRYIGKGAVVVLDPSGRVVTIWGQ